MDDSVLVRVLKSLVVDDEDKGDYVEIVRRLRNGRINKIFKIAVSQLKDNDRHDGDNNSDSMLMRILEHLSSLDDIKKDVHNISVSVKDATDALKHLSMDMDAFLSLIQASKGLSWVNIGLNSINLATTIIGFAVINPKLNRISDSISEMKETLQQLSNKSAIDIVKEYKEVKQDYVEMLDSLKRKEEFSESRYFELVKKMFIVLEYLYDCFMNNAAGNNEVILEAIYALLPMFANVISKYDTHYYYNHKSVTGDSPWHNSHTDWISLYEKLSGRDFLDKLQDYSFLNKRLSTRDSIKTISISFMLALNGKTMIEDHQKILKCFDSFEEYRQFEDFCTNEAVREIKEEIDNTDEGLAELIGPSLDRVHQQALLMVC